MIGWLGFHGGWPYEAMIMIIIVLGLREFYQLLTAKGYRPFRTLGIAVGSAVALGLFRGLDPMFLVSCSVVLLMTAELVRKDMEHSISHIAVTLFGVLYVSWLGSHLVLLRELELDEFYDSLSLGLGIARSQCINMYGMTELSTQFYDRGNDTCPSTKSGPHWIRTRARS